MVPLPSGKIILPGLAHDFFRGNKRRVENIKFLYRGVRDEDGSYPNMVCLSSDVEISRQERKDVYSLFKAFSHQFQEYERNFFSFENH